MWVQVEIIEIVQQYQCIAAERVFRLSTNSAQDPQRQRRQQRASKQTNDEVNHDVHDDRRVECEW
jgi:hypothetical protein